MSSILYINVLNKCRAFTKINRRWYEVTDCNVIDPTNGFASNPKQVSGRKVANLIWLFGDKAQREQERLERQQLFERLQEKRLRLRQQQLEEFII